MTTWLQSALVLLQTGEACVLVTIVEAEGSTPREAGTKMLVHAGAAEESIGGGHLELKAIERARTMLDRPAPVSLTDFALGPSLGQCCGGRVRLMLERLDATSLSWLAHWQNAAEDDVLATDLVSGHKQIITGEEQAGALAHGLQALRAEDEAVRLLTGDGGRPCYVLERMKSAMQDIYLFGAGHVGRALIQVLTGLPYRIHWFDERSEMFPSSQPANVTIETSADARRDVARAPGGTMFLVMTHSHALDFDICDQVLRRGDFSFLGLIGSTTKRATFERRLKLRGHSDALIRRLTCPIGLPSITGKAPAAVAISVAGQLLSLAPSQALRQQPCAAGRRRNA